MPDGFDANPGKQPAPEDITPKQTQGDGFSVMRIKEGGKDSQDREITRVYAMRPGQYAVYLAGDVRIEYADGCTTARSRWHWNWLWRTSLKKPAP